jgi:hypothetical protein
MIAEIREGVNYGESLVRINSRLRTYLEAAWKDADPDIPVLKEAKAEYAKLN